MNNKKNFTRKTDRHVTAEKKGYGRPFTKKPRREEETNVDGAKDGVGPVKKFGYEKKNSFAKPGNFRKTGFGKRVVKPRRQFESNIESEKDENKTEKKVYGRPFTKRPGKEDETDTRSEKSVPFSVKDRKSFTHKTDRQTTGERKVYSRPYTRNENRPFIRKTRSEDETNIEGENSETGTAKKFNYEKKNSFEKPRNFRKTEFGKRPAIRKSVNKTDDGLVRINKLIAASGICSRREADVLISSGLISVNGKIITELGTKVSPTDDLRYNGERMKKERLVYILLNKPKDYITTLKDPYAKRTVLELIKGACKERVYPVGRLDRNTTGVLLLTNDGDLSKKLSHPSHNRKKIYHVYLDKNLKGADVETIATGIELEDGFIKADEINFVDPKDKKQVGIEIHSGRTRIVRRIFEHLDYKVDKLDRVYFSGLSKKGLQRGEWRFLTEQEIVMLKMGSYE